ncbi:hypothetical protein [Achromobacter xylosoxidans]|uniref:hypothetical protein n=1 Tax=Alcaligenes xylosoxydans xylosoxydans TaxID=85698 RepID=UPI000FD999D3|nr:hypothetical protein [Achromobacter xylosoxidans]MCH4574556.1 hypothetical protein [Achromobacter xylosoxidans]MDD7988639.1 hypothetical protein [Achromobacter xylosoxidans]NEV05984.1 hypothetical protein [Achromobacter xylosoxidans]
MIQVTRKEFEKGWARAKSVYTTVPHGDKTNNAHRLLLFYAVENGLKALIMRTERIRDGSADFSKEKHNINRLLDRAGAKATYRIANTILIKDRIAQTSRNCSVGDINQIWRYGCIADAPSDEEIELGLRTVAQWIEEQLLSP